MQGWLLKQQLKNKARSLCETEFDSSKSSDSIEDHIAWNNFEGLLLGSITAKTFEQRLIVESNLGLSCLQILVCPELTGLKQPRMDPKITANGFMQRGHNWRSGETLKSARSYSEEATCTTSATLSTENILSRLYFKTIFKRILTIFIFCT